ncbi:MAG: hypothetical protein U0903_02815 [Planctomycetales bacterium]
MIKLKTSIFPEVSWGSIDPGQGTKIVSSDTIDKADGYLVKLTADGSFAYVTTMGTVNNIVSDRASELELDASGNAYLAGHFAGSMEILGPSATTTITSNGDDDGFVLKLDSTGNPVWAQNYGSTGGDSVDALYYDRANTLYVAGRFVNTVDFDFGRRLPT